MRLKTSLCILGIIAFICLQFIPSQSLFAQEREPIAEFLCEIAEQSHRRGNTERAIHEYSKALLVDPGNPAALAYLKRHNFDQGLYKRPEYVQYPLPAGTSFASDQPNGDFDTIETNHSSEYEAYFKKSIEDQQKIRHLEISLQEEQQKNARLNEQLKDKMQRLNDALEHTDSQLQDVTNQLLQKELEENNLIPAAPSFDPAQPSDVSNP